MSDLGRPDLLDEAAGGQVGLFKELGLFLEETASPKAPISRSPHPGYFWNIWSSGDLLSFRAQGVVGGAHDTDFPLGGPLQSEHVASLHQPEFYRMLAAKIRVHVRRGEGHPPSVPAPPG